MGCWDAPGNVGGRVSLVAKVSLKFRNVQERQVNTFIVDIHTDFLGAQIPTP